MKIILWWLLPVVQMFSPVSGFPIGNSSKFQWGMIPKKKSLLEKTSKFALLNPMNELTIVPGSHICLWDEPSMLQTIRHKMSEIVRLSRFEKNYKSISALCILGGIIANPYQWTIWIRSASFWAAFSMIHIITGTSMIINDIFDINLDKINNPERPLVKGTVTMFEAKVVTGGLMWVYALLGMHFLPFEMSPLWAGIAAVLTLYTPVFKKIFLVKNLTCASVIAASLPFIGLSTTSQIVNVDLLYTTMKLFFSTSLYIEILLDIADREGDLKMGIKTLPNVFGNYFSVAFLSNLLLFTSAHLVYNSMAMGRNLLILSLLSSYQYHLYCVVKHQFSKTRIQKAITNTGYALMIYLLVNMGYLFLLI